MSIQSLGVGSGIDLESLVGQLIEAERGPKAQRLDVREEALTTELSSVGQVKSKLSEFKDTLDDFVSDSALNEREPTTRHPSEDIEPFTAEAANTALEGTYNVAITQLASGSRLVTADADSGGFAARDETLLQAGDTLLTGGSASLIFKVGADKSFSVDITESMTLAQFREAINNADDNFGVTANIINTGNADGGFKLVFNSSITGAGNDLVIVNDNNIANLNRVSTTDSTETATYLAPATGDEAKNAKAIVDGIAVESTSNKFENTIQNVTFEASELSEMASDGVTPLTSRLVIGFDEESLREKIDEFIEKYNDVMDVVNKLTKYGSSELEDDGALAGDSTIRGLKNGMINIIGSAVQGSALGNLFQMGIEITDDGKLEIGSSDFGLGSGSERLSDALSDNFDDITKLFNAENGVGTRLAEYVKLYTESSGILSSRESIVKDQQDLLNKERENFELRMISFEQTVRDRYINLDQTVARLNQTSLALLNSL